MWPDDEDKVPSDGADLEAGHPRPTGASAPAVASSGRRSRRQERTPLQTALGLLTRREHSRRELRRKLEARGHGAEAADAALDRLSEAGWQDDARFAASLVRARIASGYGPLRIRAELLTHGLDGDAIRQALDDEAVEWNTAARDLVRRRFGSAVSDDVAIRRRAADFLIRRGFPGDAVHAATRWDPSDDD